MIASLRAVIDTVDQRLFADDDSRAKARGWTSTKAGRFGLTRIYRVSRSQADPSLKDMSVEQFTVDSATQKGGLKIAAGQRLALAARPLDTEV